MVLILINKKYMPEGISQNKNSGIYEGVEITKYEQLVGKVSHYDTSKMEESEVTEARKDILVNVFNYAIKNRYNTKTTSGHIIVLILLDALKTSGLVTKRDEELIYGQCKSNPHIEEIIKVIQNYDEFPPDLKVQIDPNYMFR